MNATTTAADPQPLRALAQANAIRVARAELRRRIADGDVSVADVIFDTPDEARNMTVSDLVTSQRRWGHTRCRKLLQGIPMSENKAVGTMTERQRRALVAALALHAAAGSATRRPAELVQGAPA